MRNNVIDFQPKETKKINKKKLAITISIIVVLLTISILAIIYCLNKNFRNVMDVYLFRKNISGENVLILIEEKFAKELEELSFVTYCDMYRFMHSGQAVAFNFSNSTAKHVSGEHYDEVSRKLDKKAFYSNRETYLKQDCVFSL